MAGPYKGFEGLHIEEPKTGRPSDYSEEMAATICEQMAEGLSLRKICEVQGMPDKSTVFRWLAKHQAFRDQYTRAQEDRAAAIAEEMFEIADYGNDEDVQRAKLRIDTRKWLLSKMAPKRFGDRQQIEHSGEGGGPVIFKTVYETRGD